MRFQVFTALFLLWCTELIAQTASFAGVAVNSATGQPLSGVHLKLFTLDVAGGASDAYGAMSGRDGRFSTTGLPPATYVLFVERAGFVHMMDRAGAIPLPGIALKAGERVTDYRLEMTPRAVIAGRVLDENGDPLQNTRVEAVPIKPDGPKAASVNDGNPTAMTNSRGEFRITGGPGRFYIKATPIRSTQVPEVRTDGSSDPSYGVTWYPSAISADRASAVEAEAGGDLALEIRLVRQRSMTITGIVSGIPDGASADVFLIPVDADRKTFGFASSTRTAQDGRFTFSRLPVAAYRLEASAPRMETPPFDVRPDGPDTVEVRLVLRAGVEVTGAVVIAGDPPAAPVEKKTVSLGSSTASTDPDGSFRIAGVFPRRYRVNVRPLPENGYLRSVEVDGVASSDLETDFARVVQGSRVKITLGRDGAQLSGAVLDKDGQPLGNSIAIVILAPDAEHISPAQEGMVKSGKYSFKAIRPGKYLLFAVDAFRSGQFDSDEDFKKLAPLAEEIEIKAGERITKDVKVVSKEDADALSKK